MLDVFISTYRFLTCMSHHDSYRWNKNVKVANATWQKELNLLTCRQIRKVLLWEDLRGSLTDINTNSIKKNPLTGNRWRQLIKWHVQTMFYPFWWRLLCLYATNYIGKKLCSKTSDGLLQVEVANRLVSIVMFKM